MKRKIIKISICAVLAAVLVVLVIGRHMASKVVMNDTYVNGNTAGNLYNQGLFCEVDGTIYFSNPDDSFHLYSMNANGTDLKLLSEDVANYINADSNYVYFVRNNISIQSDFSFLNFDTNSLCRVKNTGGTAAVLDHDPSMYASLLGNYIYYLHYDTDNATTLYKVRIDGEEREQVNVNSFFTASTDGEYLYYNGLTTDHNIYRLDTRTDTASMILACNAWMPVVTNGYAYYLDCDHGYALAKTELATGEKTTLTDDFVECYNIYGNTIYYQRNNSAALCRINTDGTGFEELASGEHTSINVTSESLYFMNYGEDGTIYSMPLNGGVISAFHPGSAEK